MTGQQVLGGAILALAVFPCAALANTAPIVTEVHAQQDNDEAGLVQVHFHLEDADGDVMSVRLFLSEDGGQTLLECLSTTPPPGSEFASGDGHIQWDAIADYPDHEGTYHIRVQAADAALPAELVVNGEFSQGSAGYFTNYTIGDCWYPGNYRVLAQAHDCHGYWQGVDHTSGDGLFAVFNGAGQAGRIAWQQEVAVTAGADYQLSFWVSSVYTASPANLQISINGSSVGTILAPNQLNSWIRFSVVWNSGESELATISIVDLNTVGSGNDFGLDDISFWGPQ